MREEPMQFKAIGPQGEEVLCQVLFAFEQQETHVHYMVYTDHTVDEGGAIRVFAATYDPEDPESRLVPVETEAEWQRIAWLLEAFEDGSLAAALEE